MADFTEGKKLSVSEGFAANVTVDLPDISVIQKKLGDMQSRAPSVQMNALNTSLTAIQNYLSAGAHKKYTYKKKITVPAKNRKRAKRNDLTAALFYRGNSVRLSQFEFRSGKPGAPRNTPGQQLEVKVKSNGSFKPISRAFYGRTTPNTKITEIYRREGSSRYPMHGLYGATDATMISQTWEAGNSQIFAQNTLRDKLDEQIQRLYLKKWGAKTR